jgi:hypothetical protein
MKKLINGFGFKMTEEQREELSDLLTKDILERYNNSEYHNYDIVESFAQDNKLQKVE